MAEIFTEKGRRELTEGKRQTAEINRRNGRAVPVEVIPIKGRHTGRVVRYVVRLLK